MHDGILAETMQRLRWLRDSLLLTTKVPSADILLAANLIELEATRLELVVAERDHQRQAEASALAQWKGSPF